VGSLLWVVFHLLLRLHNMCHRNPVQEATRVSTSCNVIFCCSCNFSQVIIDLLFMLISLLHVFIDLEYDGLDVCNFCVLRDAASSSLFDFCSVR